MFIKRSSTKSSKSTKRYQISHFLLQKISCPHNVKHSSIPQLIFFCKHGWMQTILPLHWVLTPGRVDRLKKRKQEMGGGQKVGRKKEKRSLLKKKKKKYLRVLATCPVAPPDVPPIELDLPLLLAKSALGFWMYPKVKAPFLRHLAIPGFPQSDHTVSKSVQCVQCGKQHEVQGASCLVLILSLSQAQTNIQFNVYVSL